MKEFVDLEGNSLDEERKRIAKMCFNGVGISPEELMQEAIKPPIDFIDLYAYHDLFLNPRAEKFNEENPSAKVVHVGLEFEYTGKVGNNTGNKNFKRDNKFQINYDALSFLKRLQPNSVRFINIDFSPNDEKNILQEACRTLMKDGKISFYVDGGRENEMKAQLQKIGFSSSQIMQNERGDLIDRRPDYAGMIRIEATK